MVKTKRVSAAFMACSGTIFMTALFTNELRAADKSPLIPRHVLFGINLQGCR